MSSGSTAQVALLAPRARPEAASRLPLEQPQARPVIRLAAFGALALYGMLRWATLLSGSQARVRLLGLLAVALVVAAGGAWLARRSRLLVPVLVVLALLVSLPLAGMPLPWILGARVAVSARAIGEGIGALPQALVPYLGFDPWVRTVIVLGGGLLALDAAAMLALGLRSSSEMRRAAPALPLLALAAIPTTLVHPKFAYLDGLLVFGLLAVMVWGDRVRPVQLPGAVALCGLAAAAGMILAPGLDRHRPWVNYQSLTGGLAPAAAERFDWRQQYGPIDWPRNGQTVFEVQARQADYWKAEDLDVFDGHGWVQGSLLVPTSPFAGVAQATVRQWTQTLTVTLRAIATSDVIAAGTAAPPVGLRGQSLAGPSSGTWISATTLVPGDSYQVAVYDPHPTPAQLAAAGTGYPQELLPGYLTLMVAPRQTPGGPPQPAQEVFLPPFGSPRGAAYGPSSTDPGVTLRSSPYAQAYLLARRLRMAAATPYAYVTAVQRYLARGYSYSESPPSSRYPLESFLFSSHRGYCQQFAGAMALLLRMGGVPARVATGFTPGSYDGATHRWLVSDIDAHAWVEAFFPHYGWVRFDPTPAVDPALGGVQNGAGPGLVRGSSSAPALARRREIRGASGNGSAASGRVARAGFPVELLVAVAVLVAAGLLALWLCSRPLEGTDALVTELERAFARTGRPLGTEVTLAGLEHRLRSSPSAAAYVETLRLARYRDAPSAPSAQQRRALRVALRGGLGLAGRLRAMWALPPRRRG